MFRTGPGFSRTDLALRIIFFSASPAGLAHSRVTEDSRQVKSTRVCHDSRIKSEQEIVCGKINVLQTVYYFGIKKKHRQVPVEGWCQHVWPSVVLAVEPGHGYP